MIEDESVRDVAQRLGDPLATVLAAQSETGAADTRAYLREQTRLARLQSENLIEQNAFEISHLKWRRVGDRIRGVGHFILVLLGLLVIVAFGAAIWTALNDHRLVVESFSVPPALAEQGQTGNVVAQHVLDRIVAMQNGTQSLRAANSYRNNWGDDLKVQIPDTGVSLGEVYRFLVSWLGRQTHITGEVVRSAGGFAVTARAGATISTLCRSRSPNGSSGKLNPIATESICRPTAANRNRRRYCWRLRRAMHRQASAPGPIPDCCSWRTTRGVRNNMEMRRSP